MLTLLCFISKNTHQRKTSSYQIFRISILTVITSEPFIKLHIDAIVLEKIF